MAISFDLIEPPQLWKDLYEADLAIGLPFPPARVLDIGKSNIYDAQEEKLRALFQQRGLAVDECWVREFSANSLFDPSGARINGAFLGDLCARIGLDYRALDIFDAPDVLRFDLNRDTLPPDLYDAFDLVLNCGTTEHVINQFHAFETIHSATKPGGEMLHMVPAGGYSDHGYFSYTGRFFFDLAGYNDYEIDQLSYLCNDSTSRLLDPVKNYAQHFSVLRDKAAHGTIIAPEGLRPEPALLDLTIVIRYRKKRSARFCAALDTATSIAPPPPDMLKFYDRHAAP